MYTYDYIISKEARKELVNYFINKIDEQSFSKLVEGEIPKYLYKYSGVSKYSINNIINGEFTATRPTEFNDLYDSAMHFDNVKDTKREFEEAEKIFNEFGMANLITNEMKERQLKHANRKDKYSLDYLTKEFRIACLTSNSTSITMWSHYAHDNTGICVEYDTRLINEKHLSSLYPVTYIDSPFIVSELCRNMDNLNFAILLSIVTKFKDWEYEDEWRILLPRFYVSTSKIILKALINMRFFEIQLSPIG